MTIDRDLQSILPPKVRFREFDWLNRLLGKERLLRKRILLALLSASFVVNMGMFVWFAAVRAVVQAPLMVYGGVYLALIAYAVLARRPDRPETAFFYFLFACLASNVFFPVFRYYWLVPLLVIPPSAYFFRGLARGAALNVAALAVFHALLAVVRSDPARFADAVLGPSLYVVVMFVFLFESSLLLLREYVGRNERVSLFQSRMFDETTGLPKRYLIDHIVEKAHYVDIAIVSIKNLSSIGIIMGYDFLVTVTEQIANRLREFEQAGDFRLFRLSKGEFGLVFEGPEPRALAARSESLIGDVMRRMKNTKITKGNLFIYVELDFGAALGKADQIPEILSNADRAMAGANGGADDRVPYDAESDVRSRCIEDQTKYDVLLANVTDRTMEVHFQPVVDLSSQGLVFHEALLRLRDRTGRLVSVFEYLDVAKKTGIYPRLTLFVMETVFRRMEADEDVRLSFNLSLGDLANPEVLGVLDRKRAFLRENRERVIFEITETEVSRKSREMDDFLAFARELGLRIAIDDFGSGYSNFTRLSDFPPAVCKIDGPLFQKACADPLSTKLLEGIVTLCRNLNVPTVAEYIETDDQRAFAKRLGVDFGQGYLFRRPGPDLSRCVVCE